MTDRLAAIWRNNRIPVLCKPASGDLLVRLPFRADARVFVRLTNHRPRWVPRWKAWACPRAWFERMARKLAEAYGELYVVQRVVPTEICAPSCRHAKGLDCVCSCHGENHGCESDDGWFDISETLSVRRGEAMLSVRLVRARHHPSPMPEPAEPMPEPAGFF